MQETVSIRELLTVFLYRKKLGFVNYHNFL